METVEKWNCADDPEGTVDQPPLERDLTDVSANESERNNGSAGKQSAAQHPGIPNWIPKWPDEKQRDYQVTEGKPIGAVTDEGKGSVGFLQTEIHECDPRSKSGKGFIGCRIVDAEPAAKH
jgi:hypothetical protein